MKLFYLIIIAAFLFVSCNKEEPCTTTICPDGFNNCFEKPCDF